MNAVIQLCISQTASKIHDSWYTHTFLSGQELYDKANPFSKCGTVPSNTAMVVLPLWMGSFPPFR